MFVFPQSTTMWAWLYTSKLDTTYRPLFHLLFASMFESRSIALLSWSGISFLTQRNLFHIMSLLLFGLSSNQPPANRQRGEKRKANPVYEKEKRNRKWQDSWKWVASGQEHWWLTKDEVKSIGGSLTMRWRAALVIILCPRMHNLQVGRN